MAASRLKRVSTDTDTVITQLADRESRTFVAQLDLVVQAGLEKLGLKPDGTPKPARRPAAKG